MHPDNAGDFSGPPLATASARGLLPAAGTRPSGPALVSAAAPDAPTASGRRLQRGRVLRGYCPALTPLLRPRWSCWAPAEPGGPARFSRNLRGPGAPRRHSDARQAGAGTEAGHADARPTAQGRASRTAGSSAGRARRRSTVHGARHLREPRAGTAARTRRAHPLPARAAASARAHPEDRADGAQPGSPPLPRPRGPGSSLAPRLCGHGAPGLRPPDGQAPRARAQVGGSPPHTAQERRAPAHRAHAALVSREAPPTRGAGPAREPNGTPHPHSSPPPRHRTVGS